MKVEFPPGRSLSHGDFFLVKEGTFFWPGQGISQHDVSQKSEKISLVSTALGVSKLTQTSSKCIIKVISTIFESFCTFLDQMCQEKN